MAEEETVDQTAPGTVEQGSSDLDKLVGDAVAKAAMAIEEKYKSNIAGLDRKNTELAKELESEKTAHMNDKEKAEYERTKFKEDLDKREKALADKQWDIDVADTLSAASLPVDLKRLMQRPVDGDSMQRWIENLTAYEAKREKEIRNEILLKNGGPAPRAGAAPTTATQEELDKFDFTAFATHAEAMAAWEKLIAATRVA